MLIDQVCPEVVGDRAPLRQRFVAEALSHGMTNIVANELLAIVPPPLIDARCFFDKMTSIWRYEFGLPYEVGNGLFWGTHMWIPVHDLVTAISCAKLRLADPKRTEYLQRLVDPGRHQATLVEMIPGAKLDPGVPVDFEVTGLGSGQRTIDWFIGPHANRTVLLDVKRRFRDFIEQMEQTKDGMAEAPEPEHDPAIMFQSVEQKFLEADPDAQLQGAWIVTDIQQNEVLGGVFTH